MINLSRSEEDQKICELDLSLFLGFIKEGGEKWNKVKWWGQVVNKKNLTFGGSVWERGFFGGKWGSKKGSIQTGSYVFFTCCGDEISTT